VHKTKNKFHSIIRTITGNWFKLTIFGLFIAAALAFFACNQVNINQPRIQTSSGQDGSVPSQYFFNPDSTIYSATFKEPQMAAYVGEFAIFKKPIEFTVSATDFDADYLSYSAYNLPEGASFDPVTGSFFWMPRYDQAGIYTVRFEVSDGQLTDFENVTITVVKQFEDWDVNGDASTNVLDMVLVGQHWNETGLTGWILEDANEDGTVNVLDMIIIGQHWTG
jgi:hypothetical protein